MEKLLNIIESQKELLSFIGYNIDLKKDEIPLFEKVYIKKGDNKVGTFYIKNLNLYYLDKGGYLIGNIVRNPSYSRDKEKNMHTMCHIKLEDGKTRFDCYNGIKNKHSDKNILDNCAVILNDNYTLVKTTRQSVKDLSVSYKDSNISFFFIWTESMSKIIFKSKDISIYLENENDNTYLEIYDNKKVIKKKGNFDAIIGDNKEFFDKLSNLIIKYLNVDLLNNSLKYIISKKTAEKIKTYKPE